MSSLFAIGWEYIIGAIGIAVAIFMSWSAGKSKGTTETQAKADVKEANAENHAAQAITEKQQETIRAVKDVEQNNQSLSDNAARDSMRKSKYHSED